MFIVQEGDHQLHHGPEKILVWGGWGTEVVGLNETEEDQHKRRPDTPLGVHQLFKGGSANGQEIFDRGRCAMFLQAA